MSWTRRYSYKWQWGVRCKIISSHSKGVLRLTIVEAKNLMHCDFGFFGSGQSDPYIVVSIGARRFKTKVIKKTVNPVYGEIWETEVEIVKSQSLHISVWDHDHSKEDDFMGEVRVPLKSLVERGETDLWLTLDKAKSGQVRIRWGCSCSPELE